MTGFGQVSESTALPLTLQEELLNYKDKKVTFIAYKWIGGNSVDCPRKALTITAKGISIDTCYTFKSKQVMADILVPLEDSTFFLELLRMTREEWLAIQFDLNNYENDGLSCDESKEPIIVMLNEKGNVQTFGLRRFMNCYPENSEEFLKKSENLISSIP